MKIGMNDMRIEDINQTLRSPDGFIIAGVEAIGAYLRVRYSQEVLVAGATTTLGYNLVDIFLNADGREVLRTVDFQAVTTWSLSAPPHVSAPPPVGRWYRFKNGYLIALQGLEEILKCLKQ